MKHHLTCAALAAALMISACDRPEPEPLIDPEAEAPTAHAALTPEQEAFWNNLQDLCNERFRGETVFIAEPEANPDLARGPLFMHLESCTEQEIRIPVVADQDSSRTWFLTVEDEGLLLKHDHRHPDGTPHDLTNYGGYATAEGSETEQFFPADEFTREMLPEAETNVWSLTIDRENDQFIYYLERHAQPRFRAEFDLGRPVEPGE